MALMNEVVMRAMGFEDARHFLSRTGFGGTPAEIRQLASKSRAQAVVEAIDGLKLQPHTKPPEWVHKPLPPRRKLKMLMGDKKAVQMLLRTRAIDLKTWWLDEMVQTPSALTERLTLFWHNHFVTSMQKVRRPVFLYQQNRMLREHAAGNFRDFVHAVSKDAAMILYLDTQQNRRKSPNENFARELMELFTLGEGAGYTERDIKEAARAFTGWSTQKLTGEFKFRRFQHDSGSKTVLGTTGDLSGGDVIEIILKRREFGPMIVEKLWAEFITTPIPTEQRRKLVNGFRRDFEIRPLVSAILSSKEFWADANRGTRVKSPVEFVVGLVRVLGLRLENPKLMVKACRDLGQDVFSPPNVKGWKQGPAWIDASSLLRRQLIASRVRQLDSTAADDPAAWLGVPTAQVRSECARVLLPSPPVQTDSANLGQYELGELLLDPVFQLA